jgi:hypothetical protein
MLIYPSQVIQIKFSFIILEFSKVHPNINKGKNEERNLFLYIQKSTFLLKTVFL